MRKNLYRITATHETLGTEYKRDMSFASVCVLEDELKRKGYTNIKVKTQGSVRVL